MANTITHKKSAVENRIPQAGDLALGELAVNTADGNIYFKKSDDSIAEMKRLDSRLNEINVTQMTYNDAGDLSEVTYESGNKIVLNYNITEDLTSVDYYATNGTTHLYTQTLTYDDNGNVETTTWSVA